MESKNIIKVNKEDINLLLETKKNTELERLAKRNRKYASDFYNKHKHELFQCDKCLDHYTYSNRLAHFKTKSHKKGEQMREFLKKNS